MLRDIILRWPIYAAASITGDDHVRDNVQKWPPLTLTKQSIDTIEILTKCI